MRAAGCIWNDLNDKDYDIRVERTKKRLIASGKVSKKKAILFLIINLSLGSLPLLFIGKKAILLSFLVLPLVITYPLMKRITWWPQLWLGINFNWGLLIAYTAVENVYFYYPIILFYIGSIFWTIAYDTIYGFQDIKDDLIIGLKSTSIKFRKNAKLFLSINYFLCFVLWSSSLTLIKKDSIVLILIFFLFLLIVLKVLITSLYNPLSCEKAFKNNSYFAFFISLLLIYFNL